MIDKHGSRFCALLEEHAIAFDIKLKPERMSVYFEKLKRWPAKGIEQAIEDCFYSCYKFPTIHDIAKAYHAKNPNR